MPLDPIRVADTQAWLRRANRDLRAADHDMKADPPLHDAVVFHCQQAAEKSLKALLMWHDLPFRRPTTWKRSGPRASDLMRRSRM
jgi:HEPN domain-containing protein